MSKDNYDDLADFCGPKDFYDLDGDGHIDTFEAAMMLSDVEDELRASEQHRDGSYTPPSHSSGKEPKRSGCLLTSGWFWLAFILYSLFSEYCEHRY